MATVILNDGTQVIGTQDEVSAILASVTRNVPVRTLDNSHTEKVAKRISKPNSTGIRATVCGHAIARKGAGRPPRYCEACQGGTRRSEPQAKPQGISESRTAKFNRKYGRKATTDPAKVRAQVIRYAEFASARGLISKQDAASTISRAREVSDFESLSKLKKALSNIISAANAWTDYMAQRKS